MMHAHYLQHVPFEGLGSIEAWLEMKKYTITGTQFFKTFSLPDISDVDILIVLGGPMSVNDTHRYPWLVPEMKYIKDFIKSGKPILGICLGAQLIAKSLGAKVYRNPVKEIGWFPIKGVPVNGQKAFFFSDEIMVFHWHGETIELPPPAILLAESEACTNQAFQIGSSVIGLQFHLETTIESAMNIVVNCRDELVEGEYIQSESQLLKETELHHEKINILMGNVLAYLINRNN